MTVPFGAAEDYLELSDSDFECIAGPNFRRQVDGAQQANKASGVVLQENAARVKVTGNQRYFRLNTTGTLPAEGLYTIGTGTTKVWIDSVNEEGKEENGHTAVAVEFHYWEDLAAGEATRTDYGLS